MKKILFAWIGKTDLDAQKEIPDVGLGPIARAVVDRGYDEIVLLSNYPSKDGNDYIGWLQGKTDGRITLHQVELTSPTSFEEIYKAAIEVIPKAQNQIGTDSKLTFHLSPGTPTMAAVWVILGKTRYPAELIQSDKRRGVTTASVPFDMSAEYIPNLIQGPDSELWRLSIGLPPEAPEFDELIHQSAEMKRVILKARLVSPRSIPVLIEGESGTGKELLARAIHQAGPRKNKPFIAVNCGAIPENLVESELFGYEKGAFTGAEKARPGHFENADEGTLFLDEIGELPLQAQVKLLRTLQEKKVVRVGSSQPKDINVRIIAATNREVLKEIAAGKFRADLFYRLGVAILKLPPLRERQGDLGLLIEHLLGKINEDCQNEPGYKRKKLSPAAKNLLLKHSWPGNVRELYNTLMRAAIWSPSGTIDPNDVQDALLPEFQAPDQDVLNRSLGNEFSLQDLLGEVARHYLHRALEEAHGSKTKASKLVGFSNYQTLSNWMKKFGVGENV